MSEYQTGSLELKSNSGGVLLREFFGEDDDFNQYCEWLRDPETVKFIGRKEYLLTTHPDAIKEYLHTLSKSSCDSFFKIIYESKFIGTFKIGHINWETRTADMGIMIGDKKYRSKGISINAMDIALDYSFNVLGLMKATGGCLSGNIPMQKCFSKSGFKLEGCIRKYMFVGNKLEDHLLYGILQEEYRGKNNEKVQ